MLDPGMADNSVQVDFVADPTFVQSRWEQLNINDYWPTNELRIDSKPITLRFGPNEEKIQIISVKDPRYAEWLKQKPLFAVVIEDSPIHLPEPGPNDPRRLILSLDKKHWAKRTKELTVVIQQSGLKVTTPLNPKKK